MTIRILYGHPPRPLRLYSTTRYTGMSILWRLQSLCNRHQPLYMEVENTRHLLRPCELRLAAEMAASYHNQICYNLPPDDGWADETACMEEAAEQHMHDPLSDDSDDNQRRSDSEHLF